MGTDLQRFNQSALGGFIESPLGARGGPAGDIYAGGQFAAAFKDVARYDSVLDQWFQVGGGITSAGDPFNFHSGSNFLYMNGLFTAVDGLSNTRGIAKWDGLVWSEVAGGVVGGVFEIVPYLNGLAIVGGYTSAGGVANTQNACLYNEGSQTYSSLWSGTAADGDFVATGTSGASTLVVGGSFINIQGTRLRKIAQLNGGIWSIVGSPSLGEVGLNNTVSDILEFQGELWVIGIFTASAKSDGSGVQALNKVAKRVGPLGEGGTWVQPGPGILTSSQALILFIWRGEMYVGGTFRLANGDPVEGFFRYDQATDSYQQVGPGIVSTVSNTRVDSFTEDKDGNLIIGGLFNETGDGSLTGLGNVVGWNGSNYFKLSTGTGGLCLALAKFP